MVVVVLPLAGCGDSASDPGSASSCKELMDRAANVTRQIVEDLDDATAADLEKRDAANPYRVLTEPYAGFQERAAQLGCDEGDLRRLACDAYRGLQPRGPVAEEFLAGFAQDCL